jgi:hypothetical protein
MFGLVFAPASTMVDKMIVDLKRMMKQCSIYVKSRCFESLSKVFETVIIYLT